MLNGTLSHVLRFIPCFEHRVAALRAPQTRQERQLHAVRSILTALFIGSFFAPVSASPQSAPPTAPGGRKPLRVVVDGEKNPERIPDRVAIAMFLSSIAIPVDADNKAVASMETKTASMKLSGADMTVLRSELAGLQQRLLVQGEVIAAANRQAQRLRTKEAAATATAAVETRWALAMESYGRLLETLSTDGRKKLVAQIAVVKSDMKTLGRAR